MNPKPSSAPATLETDVPGKPPRPRTNAKAAAPADTDAAAPEAEPAPQQFAKIRTLRKGVKACGFTFGKNQIVPKVPLEHAEFLKKNTEAEILNVFSA